MRKIIVKKKSEPKKERISKFLKKFLISSISLVCSILYVVVAIIANNIREILEPLLRSAGVPSFIYSSFSFYVAVFIAISYINKSVVKKQMDLEDDLSSECIDEDVLEDIKNINKLKDEHRVEIARLKSTIDSKDKMIAALINDRSVNVEMNTYNQVRKDSGNVELKSVTKGTVIFNGQVNASKDGYKY